MTDQTEDAYLLLARIAGLEAGIDTLLQQKAALQTEVDVLRHCNRWQATRITEQAQQLSATAARIGMLELAVIENHRWHQQYDDHDGYPGSALEQTNVAALSLANDDELDQRVADWHEGRAGQGQELHEYLGLTWAEYAARFSPWPPGTTDKQIRHYLVGPLRPTPEEPTMTDDTEQSPVHRALLEHLDHLLINLLPFCHGEATAQVLAAGLMTVKTLRDLALIENAEVLSLAARVRAVCEAHDPELKAFFDDVQPPE